VSRGGLIGAIMASSLAAAPAALADTQTSSNWSGYAVHRTGVDFRRVQGSWIQPTATCQPGQIAYSAFWVGLGGYTSDSSALEQIGTKLDCYANGQVKSSAWYELVPAPVKSLRMAVTPGDRMSASVTVVGDRVTLRLTDHTRHTSFVKTVTAATVDVSSAEWIAEAPSACDSHGVCEALPLTDFESVLFTAARAWTTSRAAGPISSPNWSRTRLVLRSGGRAFLADAMSGSTPSPLRASGTAFDVRYSETGALPSPPPFFAGHRQAAASNSRAQPRGARR
jgi:hypothetical protein